VISGKRDGSRAINRRFCPSGRQSLRDVRTR
jgi:hypothetical protein